MTDDGMLSQDEIDALLKVSENNDEEEPSEENDQPLDQLNVNDYLTTIEKDTLGEIGNISFGSSATTLSTLLNEKVEITTPTVSVIKKKDLLNEFPFEHVNIQVNYLEGFIGENMFVMKSEDAAVIADIMMDGDGQNPETHLGDIHLSAIQEVMNQMMGSAATSMSTIFNKRVNISPPSIELVDSTGEPDLKKEMDEEVFVQVSFQLKVGDLIDSKIMQIIPFPFAHELVEELFTMKEDDHSEERSEPTSEQKVVQESERQDPLIEDSSPSVGEKVNQTVKTKKASQEQQLIGGNMDKNMNQIQTASFSEFEQVDLSQSEQQNLEMLLDIPLQITVELGRTHQTVKDILELSAGSIVELDKLAGEPVDILVNKKLIAQGEVVVIDENFGVRVTDVVSQTDRLMKLK